MLNGVVSPDRYGQLLDASREAVTKTKDPVKLLLGGVLAVGKRTK